MGMFCEKCGCKLASDHRGDVCTPCSRSTPTLSEDAPPTAPAGFWQRDDVHAAIAERHFGKIICAYRCAFSPPINQGRMAEWLGVGQSQVSRIERGLPPADLVKLTQWARVLQAPASLLWFQLPGNASDTSPIPEPAPNLVPHQHHDRGDDVQRRDVLKLAGAAAMSAAPWQQLANTLEHGYAPDAAAISLIEDRTTEFFHLEETTPSRTILASLTEHGATLRQLLDATTREQDRRRLLSAAGEAEALAGWLAFDLSQPREAVSRYKHALKLAEEAGDGPLTACTLNYWSYLLASQDKSAEAVEVLGKAGEYVRGSAATTQAWVSGRQAEEAARVGDGGTAERALERAFTAYDYARPQHERSWTSFFGASRLGSLAVSSYGRLGHSETDSLASSLLSALSPTDTKVRALVVSDLALSAATRSDIDRADALAREAFPLAVRTEASLAQDRLLELTEVLPQGNGRGTADALRQQITSALLGSSQA